MIAVMKMTAGQPESEKPQKGPSYKEKLAQKRGTKPESTVSPPQAQTLSETQSSPGVIPDREAAYAESLKSRAAPAVPQATAPPASVQPDRMEAHAVPTQPSLPQTPAMSTSPPAATAPLSDETEDRPEVRRGFRTLMGLILKHRGGPGFGMGRLKGEEAEGFEKLLGEITELLRSEASSGGIAAAQVNVAAPAQSIAPPPPIQQQKVATPPQSVAMQPPQRQVLSSPSPPQQQFSSPAAVSSAMTYTAPGPPDQRMTSTIACVEGAVLMYKNSPSEIREGLMIPLRGALMSAMNTCNQIIVEKQLDSSLAASGAMVTSPGSVNERMSTMIACVEGAVQMYKNSPPAVQECLLVPLLGALMSAVNTCNKIIAEKEMDNVQAYQDAVTESPVPVESKTTAPTPGQFFEVAPYTPEGSTNSGEEATLSMATDKMTTMASEPEIASGADVSAFSGTDDNSVFLQTVYDSLEASSGDEKFGLGRLSSSEVSLTFLFHFSSLPHIHNVVTLVLCRRLNWQIKWWI